MFIEEQAGLKHLIRLEFPKLFRMWNLSFQMRKWKIISIFLGSFFYFNSPIQKVTLNMGMKMPSCKFI